jgi:hypothetical protein
VDGSRSEVAEDSHAEDAQHEEAQDEEQDHSEQDELRNHGVVIRQDEGGMLGIARRGGAMKRVVFAPKVSVNVQHCGNSSAPAFHEGLTMWDWVQRGLLVGASLLMMADSLGKLNAQLTNGWGQSAGDASGGQDAQRQEVPETPEDREGQVAPESGAASFGSEIAEKLTPWLQMVLTAVTLAKAAKGT